MLLPRHEGAQGLPKGSARLQGGQGEPAQVHARRLMNMPFSSLANPRVSIAITIFR